MSLIRAKFRHVTKKRNLSREHDVIYKSKGQLQTCYIHCSILCVIKGLFRGPLPP